MATATAEPKTFSQTSKPSEASSSDARSGKYLTFRLAREEFAIQVLRVREIMGMQDITAVPQTPHYMKGVINLRGKIVPVIDLRSGLGFRKWKRLPATCIIVVQLHLRDARCFLMGLLVDAVSEVLNFAPSDIGGDTPDFGKGVSTPYLLGIAKDEGRGEDSAEHLTRGSQFVRGCAEYGESVLQ